MASTAWLLVTLPVGWDALQRGLPDDLAALLVDTSAEFSGGGYDQDTSGTWRLRKQVTGPDRLAVAETLVRGLTSLGYRAEVQVRR